MTEEFKKANPTSARRRNSSLMALLKLDWPEDDGEVSSDSLLLANCGGGAIFVDELRWTSTVTILVSFCFETKQMLASFSCALAELTFWFPISS